MANIEPSGAQLVDYTIAALRKIYKQGYLYKRGGVIVMDFAQEESLQPSLFENSDKRHAPLMEAMDTLNGKYGQHKLRLAAQGFGKIWKMKQERLSSCYTTKISDIITIHA